MADHVIAHGIDAPGRYRAVRELLLRRPPRVNGILTRDALRRPGESALGAALRLATTLDESTLAIQGPPGTGKTWTGARMILELVRAGRRVGVTAQSHKAITNIVLAIDDAARAAGLAVRVIQKCDGPEDGAGVDAVEIVTDPKGVGPALRAGRFDVAAGTPWLFGRSDMAGAIDTLFVDEAGQMALANVVAMGGAARSIVLLGDPNQLPQVSQGVHPEGAGKSALEHLVGDRPTIEPHRGLLLDVTYRLHPSINEFISEVFYAGELTADPSTALQRIGGGAGLEGSGDVGLRFVAIDHEGDSTSSRPEAEAVADAVAALVGREWTDAAGQTRPLGLDDVVVVAPYNAHVAEIERALRARIGSAGRVGTVDRFQGQEAAAAIYSMAASSPDDVPRGVDFLYNRNRFNVAVSRGEPRAAARPLPDARADAARERALPVRRDGGEPPERRGGSGRWGRTPTKARGSALDLSGQRPRSPVVANSGHLTDRGYPATLSEDARPRGGRHARRDWPGRIGREPRLGILESGARGSDRARVDDRPGRRGIRRAGRPQPGGRRSIVDLGR
ncbi:MAG: hypothetical protein E6I94_05925, partial [Chloroflexi bacterium]